MVRAQPCDRRDQRRHTANSSCGARIVCSAAGVCGDQQIRMRYQGRITEWKDDRGFGFITPNGGGTRVFVHISAFRIGRQRPSGNELVTYELLNDKTKGFRAADVDFVEMRQLPVARIKRRGGSSPFVALIVVAGIGIYAYQHVASRTVNPPAIVESLTVHPPALVKSPSQSLSTVMFQCQGKRYCSQMTSCEEATFYLRNCPGVQIDGDGDGIPCESQWCGH